MIKTNVMRMLDKAKIPYEAKEYIPDEQDLRGVHIAEQIGIPAGQCFKTIVARGDKTGPVVFCIPADEEIDLKKAAKITELSPTAFREEDDIGGDIELYCFSSKDIYITVTKSGGFVHSFIRDIVTGEATITPEEAVRRGLSYLEKLGYKSMKESYYSVYDGICTVNYAYVQNGVICYSDLIKVSISLDKGEAVALDASAWLSNHRTRRILKERVTEDTARENLAECLTVLSVRKALIPTDSGKEVLCYEFHCKDSISGREVLVYTDCRTGEEQDIMLLLYEDDGILTR